MKQRAITLQEEIEKSCTNNIFVEGGRKYYFIKPKFLFKTVKEDSFVISVTLMDH